MQKVVVMGECMVEFSPNTENSNYKQSFAGDVYNTAVYLKRLQKKYRNNLFFIDFHMTFQPKCFLNCVFNSNIF